MCGIAGFTGPNDRAALERMTQSLRHRGPDSAGFWEGPGVSLGARRLAIIDVATGEQPVFNEDKTVAVRPVTLGVSHGEVASVTSGLAPDELVVVDGTEKLREGSTVEVRNRNEKSAQGEAPSAAASPSRGSAP